ncbi:unnamed protein product, partial [Polarella glacialis]
MGLLFLFFSLLFLLFLLFLLMLLLFLLLLLLFLFLRARWHYTYTHNNNNNNNNNNSNNNNNNVNNNTSPSFSALMSHDAKMVADLVEIRLVSGSPGNASGNDNGNGKNTSNNKKNNNDNNKDNQVMRVSSLAEEMCSDTAEMWDRVLLVGTEGSGKSSCLLEVMRHAQLENRFLVVEAHMPELAHAIAESPGRPEEVFEEWFRQKSLSPEFEKMRAAGEGEAVDWFLLLDGFEQARTYRP